MLKINLSCLIVTACVLLTSNSYADIKYSRWVKKVDRSGVRIISRSVSNSKYKELQGSISLNTKVESLIGLMKDINVCSQWMYKCVEGKILQEIRPPIERINYTVIKDWPLEFDSVVRSNISLSRSTNIVKITLQGEENYIPRIKGRIRLKNIKGYWKFEPTATYSKINGGKIKVIYQMFFEPNQILVSNNDLIVNMYNTLINMRTIITTDRYKNYSINKNFIDKISTP